MNIVSFEYIKAIAEHGTISKAAEELFITQPALSQSLNKLEAELGLKLFKRQGNRMYLTEAGAIFVEEGTSIIRSNERLKERLGYISNGKKDTVRLGLSRFYGKLPHLLERFIHNHPGVQFEITEGLTFELEKKFENGDLDICIVPSSSFTEAYGAIPLFKEELLVAIPRMSSLNQYYEESGGHKYYDISHLKNEPFISLTSTQRIYYLGIDFCKAAGFEPNILCTVFGYDTLLMLVSMGLGVGFFSSLQKKTLDSMVDSPRYYHIISELPVHREYVLLTKDALGKLGRELAESIIALNK